MLRLLDQVGAPALDAALAEARARGAISAASVAHVLEQRRRARRLGRIDERDYVIRS